MDCEKKELILSCADHLFQKKGYEMTNVSEIASMANISKGAIYQYFDSKEQIATVLVDQKVNSILEDLAEDMDFVHYNHRFYTSLYNHFCKTLTYNDWIFETKDNHLQSLAIQIYSNRVYQYLETRLQKFCSNHIQMMEFPRVKLKMICGSFYRLFRQNIYMWDEIERSRMIDVYFDIVRTHIFDYFKGEKHEQII